jgi:hypothetical protein
MTELATCVFARVYQSYLMGADTYSYRYAAEKPTTIEKLKKAISEIEGDGLVTVLFQSEKKTKMCITEQGIDYGSSITDFCEE